MVKKFLTFCSLILLYGVMAASPLLVDSFTCENLEKTEKEVELEKEEEIFSSLAEIELEYSEALYDLNDHPDLQLVDYTVYLAKKIRPPRS